MTYFNKNKELKRGYNAYIDESTNYMGTRMNVGLLVISSIMLIDTMNNPFLYFRF